MQDHRIMDEMERLNGMVDDFAREFSRLVGDTHFDARLALSQARSLITSSRLVTDPEFARGMFLRGVRSLERALELAA
jgi:hypothetical protein